MSINIRTVEGGVVTVNQMLLQGSTGIEVLGIKKRWFGVPEVQILNKGTGHIHNLGVGDSFKLNLVLKLDVDQ